ncbi:MAG: thioredoxin family protein [Gammaproteobacteria bacterium]|nr:thioredoxin family protein [Gammaproteobacteria bacterium]
MKQLPKTAIAFLAGIFLGLVAYHSALVISGQTPVRRELIDEQQAQLDRLQEENLELTEELFRPRGVAGIVFNQDELPYDGEADAASVVNTARAAARAENRFLMVTFGANWCLDCRTLHHHLGSEPVAGYTRDLFRFVFVDVGKLNQNRDVAESLGVSLASGIPVAVFFDRNGELIGTTNEGQLEPARYYSSKQILKFVRDIAERNRILAPDSVD